MHTGQSLFDMKVNPIGESLGIGSHEYEGLLHLHWTSTSRHRVGVGIGYNLVFSNRISVNAGLQHPLGGGSNGVNYIAYQNDSIRVADADVPSMFSRIESTRFHRSIMFFVNVGLNFPAM